MEEEVAATAPKSGILKALVALIAIAMSLYHMYVAAVGPPDTFRDGSPWPLAGRTFGAIVVTNYLHRPLLPVLVASLDPGGVLVYETFARGNEKFGKPSNPDFLLAPGELLEAVRGRLRVVAYEDLVVTAPRPAAVQRLCARREDANA